MGSFQELGITPKFVYSSTLSLGKRIESDFGQQRAEQYNKSHERNT